MHSTGPSCKCVKLPHVESKSFELNYQWTGQSSHLMTSEPQALKNNPKSESSPGQLVNEFKY